jgi:hypothetical protein
LNLFGRRRKDFMLDQRAALLDRNQRPDVLRPFLVGQERIA